MTNKLIFGALSLLLIIFLSACGTKNNETNEANNRNSTAKSGTDVTNEITNTNENEKVGLDSLNSTADKAPAPLEIPEGMKEAKNPKFKVGDQVVINAEHKEGMKGSTGTVNGAFDTIVYSVSYTPIQGDYPEENHKWVVQEELKGLDEKMLVPGSEVILETNQEDGMLGAQGKIDTAEQTVVYMVEYISANGTSYRKWFKESELSAK